MSLPRRSGVTVDQIERLPLFLLHSVLFPGQRLPLRVFETRYMDVISASLRNNSPFGICLIRRGQEVGEVAEPVTVGTLARIERWEMRQSGVLEILVGGGRRFEIRALHLCGRLNMADVSPWDGEIAMTFPSEFQPLATIARQLVRDYGGEACSEPHRFEDADWVGMRLAQLLPFANGVKQTLLEEQDPLRRLAAIKVSLEDMAKART